MFFHHSTAHAEAKVDVAYEISVLEVGGVTCMRTTNWFVLFLDIIRPHLRVLFNRYTSETPPPPWHLTCLQVLNSMGR